uniref:Uncharacterized protein n=1 Tax=Oryza punctata TaxID=4537 RepID=A0A0E0M8R2_ORYPU
MRIKLTGDLSGIRKAFVPGIVSKATGTRVSSGKGLNSTGVADNGTMNFVMASISTSAGDHDLLLPS